MFGSFGKRSAVLRGILMTRPLRQLGGLPLKRVCYSTTSGRATGLPSIWKLVLIAAAGTVVFVGAARSLDKKRPTISLTEEFDERERARREGNVMNGLRRRVSLYQPDEVDINVVYDEKDLKKLQAPASASPTTKVIDVLEIVKNVIIDEDNHYEPLVNQLLMENKLNPIDDQDLIKLNELLPNGLIVKLLLQEFLDKISKGDTVYITNFPLNSLKNFIKFENEVSVINSFTIDKNSFQNLKDNEIIRYYETVSKINLV